MARPLRIEYPGAYYHVMSRGNERRPIVRGTGINFASSIRTDHAHMLMVVEGAERPSSCSAQGTSKLRRRFSDELVPNAGSATCVGLSAVHVRGRAESPRTARVRLRFWLDSGFQVRMEAATIGALAIEHSGRAISQG